MNISLLLSKLGVSPSLSQDIMLIVFIALVSFIYGMLLGRHKLMTVLINIYAAFAVVSVAPKSILPDYNAQSIAFLAVIVLMTVLDKHFFDISISGAGTGFLFRVFSMSFLEIVLVLSIIFSFTPSKIAAGYISTNALHYLTAGWAPLIWMAAPLVYMFFIYKKINK